MNTITQKITQHKWLSVLTFMLLSLLLLVFALSVGSEWLSPMTVILNLLGKGTGEYDFVLQTLRLPRVLLAFLVGAALAVSGLILQSIIRNPLGSPDIIGITGGASVGALLFLTFFGGTVSISFLPIAALIGAAAVSVLVYLLSWKNGVAPITLILIGIGVSAAMKAVTTMVIVFSDTVTTSKAYLWMTGSVYGANWTQVYGMLPWVAIFIPLTLLFAKTVQVKLLGDDIATGLGVRVQLQRFLLLFISVALAGSAVAFAGGISFVGLIAPHIARKLVGPSFAALVPLSAIVGGFIVVIADVVARTAFLPLDLPAGVFTAGIGAPFFIYLLLRKSRSGFS
ncbi:iron ABC transporter permease [Alkalihalobacillus oceani]|uniref:Iron ABC transporter permease n=1 Tax=Halalkalibacter oceani TaxID=1653776 RepID=A0A9X2DVZ9_9BACI|nr:iron ABC transporter permease [Halalkalibacter oceani]MCM3716440.1 iron ABC transporter permease [Halalkalibacter oceani]